MMSVCFQEGEQFCHVADFGMMGDDRVSRLAPAFHPDSGHFCVLCTGEVSARFVTDVSESRSVHVRPAAGFLEHSRMGFGFAGGYR